MRPTAKRALGVGLALLFAACTRDEIVNVEPGNAPGESAETVESLISTSGLSDWIDTVFFGFSDADGASFTISAAGAALASRALIRFGSVPSDVFVRDTFSDIVSYDSTKLILPLDTARSMPASGGTTLRLVSVSEEWDAGSADWQFAIDSLGVAVPWSVPGGAFGDVLAEAVADTGDLEIVFDLAAISDSLLQAWADTTRQNNGVAVVAVDSGRITATLPRITFLAVPEADPDSMIALEQSPSERTFIFDPPAPLPPAGALRLGGIDGWRIYTQLLIPDSIEVSGGGGRLSIAGAQVQRAELILHALAPPPAPFTAEAPFGGGANRLADDFTVLGAKTPLAEPIIGSNFTLDPDSLEVGSTVRIDLTGRLQQVADSLDRFGMTIQPKIRIGVRALPEAGTFGYWEFGSSEGDPALAPVIRIVFTPDTEFGLPD